MTRRRLTETHGRPYVSGARILLVATLAALATFPGRGAAEPRPLEARVVWARADRVYIAAPDSLALAPGDLLTVRRGRKTVASGEVVQVLARDLAAARLTTGSLERTSRLDRLRVLAERPPLRALALLRIGYPGRRRASLLFECARPRPHAPLAGFRTDSLAENAYRFVRSAAPGAPWPDTILVRLFGESADQEIALERGELDIAVFWPGEASSRLRADPRWQGLAYGSRGVLAAIAPAGDTAVAGALTPDLAPLAALNDALFRGDLAPLRDAGASPAPSARPPAPASLRFVVDPSCPGRPTIERFLARVSAGAGARPNAATIRLSYLDSPVDSPDSLGVTPLFRVRCAVAFEPGLRAHVAALGADGIVDMLECDAEGRAP